MRRPTFVGVRAQCSATGALLPWGVVMPYIAAPTVPGALFAAGFTSWTDRWPTPTKWQLRRCEDGPAAGRLRDGAADCTALERLRLDPAEIRRRTPHRTSQMPYPVVCIRYGTLWSMTASLSNGAFERALALFTYCDFPLRQKGRTGKRAAYTASALGSYVQGTRYWPSRRDCALARRWQKSAVNLGARAQGQGHKTCCSRSWPELGVARRTSSSRPRYRRDSHGCRNFCQPPSRANAAPSALIGPRRLSGRRFSNSRRTALWRRRLGDLQLDNGKVAVKSGNRRAIASASWRNTRKAFPILAVTGQTRD